ncbi:MAG: recombinase family protein [Rhodospirillaceae bacterium]
MTKPRLRCAIYTRKSSEEGLQQEFNSLDAQREACEAYIKSQASEGWRAVTTRYDDGGFSGGNMDRPGLKKLMADISGDRVDIVVVYKVDRLTRSLSDFAKMIDRFDAKKVSFVSVTQSFNTTTSMGRLTLNVLLSFAQFEREVTGERIRDKIAASKKKGMWMGGYPPLGYDVVARTLRINAKEADTVRSIYKRYLDLGSVAVLQKDLLARGVKTKTWVTATGKRIAGAQFAVGALYYLLQNRIYRGEICHKGTCHPGQHEAIIPAGLWEKVQAQLAKNRVTRSGTSAGARTISWLTGKLFDVTGAPMSPTFTSRPNGKRYRYYLSQPSGSRGAERRASIVRIPAQLIEEIVKSAMAKSRRLSAMDPLTIREAIQRVLLSNRDVRIETTAGENGDRKKSVTLRVPIRIAGCGRRMEIIPPADMGVSRADQRLVDALRQAWQWRRELERGIYPTPELLAEAKGVSKRYVNKMLPLGFLEATMMQKLVEKTMRSDFRSAEQ